MQGSGAKSPHAALFGSVNAWKKPSTVKHRAVFPKTCVSLPSCWWLSWWWPPTDCRCLAGIPSVRSMNTCIREHVRNCSSESSSHFEDGRGFFKNQLTSVLLSHVGVPNTAVASGWVERREAVVCEQRPHALLVHLVRGNAALLAERPQLHSPVRTPR